MSKRLWRLPTHMQSVPYPLSVFWTRSSLWVVSLVTYLAADRKILSWFIIDADNMHYLCTFWTVGCVTFSLLCLFRHRLSQCIWAFNVQPVHSNSCHIPRCLWVHEHAIRGARPADCWTHSPRWICHMSLFFFFQCAALVQSHRNLMHNETNYEATVGWGDTHAGLGSL